MRLGVPYKVVGGTRFYDRREIKDAMAYLRAVVNPADEVERQARAQRAQAWRRRCQHRQARRARRGRWRRFRRGAAPAPTTPASPGRRGAASSRSSACSTSLARWSAPRTSDPGDLLHAALRPVRLPRRAGGGGHRRVSRSVGEPQRARRVGTGVHRARRVPRAGGARRRHRRDHRRRPGRADDAALGEGARVPRRVPDRCRGGRVPARSGAERARRAGGGAAAGVRRHHPRPRAPLRDPRVEPQPVRVDAVQPAVTVPGGDPRRPGRVAGQHHRSQRATVVRACAHDPTGVRHRRTAAGVVAVQTTTGSERSDEHRERVVDAALAAAATRRYRATPTTSGCGSATTSSTRRSARA